MAGFRRAISVVAVLALLLQGATAGVLDDFEEKAGEKKKKSESSSKSRRSRDADSSSYSSNYGRYDFLGGLLYGLVSLPFRSRYDNSIDSGFYGDGTIPEEEWADEGDGLNLRHGPGSAILPYLRADYNRQHIDSNLDAEDIRLEAGYKMLAFHGRHTRYMEHDPSDELTINQFYGVFRLGGTYPRESGENLHGWEIGLGLGVAQQKGNKEHSSGAFTIPIKFHPTEWFGLEFRPAWYRPQEKTIGDYDLSASLGWRYLQLRGGYRWLWLQGEGHFFNGPYAGVSVAF